MSVAFQPCKDPELRVGLNSDPSFLHKLSKGRQQSEVLAFIISLVVSTFQKRIEKLDMG